MNHRSRSSRTRFIDKRSRLFLDPHATGSHQYRWSDLAFVIGITFWVVYVCYKYFSHIPL